MRFYNGSFKEQVQTSKKEEYSTAQSLLNHRGFDTQCQFLILGRIGILSPSMVHFEGSWDVVRYGYIPG